MDVSIPCPCPPKADGEPRHAGDTVVLRERLDFRAVTTIRKAVAIVQAEDPGAGAAEILAALTEHYLLSGVESWSLVDAKNKPIEVTRPNIRDFLASIDAATTVSDAADELYAPTVLLPLLARAQSSSPPTQTDTSTSAKTSSTPQRPKPSKRSSTTNTRTGGTGTITRLPVGDSSSSPSSKSAR